jgi:hypothetical protein
LVVRGLSRAAIAWAFSILICAHWGKGVESYDQFLSRNRSIGNTNYSILLVPNYIKRIPRFFNFLILSDSVGDTQKYMRKYYLERGWHLSGSGGEIRVAGILSFLRLRMLAGENHKARRGRPADGNSTNALLDNKTFGIGMASETGEHLKESRHILSGRMPVIIESEKQCKLRAVVDIICKGSGQFWWGINGDPRALFFVHRVQLSIKDHGRTDGCNRRDKRENCGGEQRYNSSLFAFGALALFGMAAAAIGVYRICYCYGDMRFWEASGNSEVALRSLDDPLGSSLELSSLPTTDTRDNSQIKTARRAKHRKKIAVENTVRHPQDYSPIFDQSLS